jgi:hypothetical protein
MAVWPIGRSASIFSVQHSMFDVQSPKALCAGRGAGPWGLACYLLFCEAAITLDMIGAGTQKRQ